MKLVAGWPRENSVSISRLGLILAIVAGLSLSAAQIPSQAPCSCSLQLAESKAYHRITSGTHIGSPFQSPKSAVASSPFPNETLTLPGVLEKETQGGFFS